MTTISSDLKDGGISSGIQTRIERSFSRRREDDRREITPPRRGAAPLADRGGGLDTDKTIERVEIYLAASRVRELFGLLTDIKTEGEIVEMFSTFVERLEKLLNEK